MELTELKAAMDRRFERITADAEHTRRYLEERITADAEQIRRHLEERVTAEGEKTRQHFDVVAEQIKRSGT